MKLIIYNLLTLYMTEIIEAEMITKICVNI